MKFTKQLIRNTSAFYMDYVVLAKVLEMTKYLTVSIEILNVHTGNGVHNSI